MTDAAIKEAVAEAKRFLKAADAALKKHGEIQQESKFAHSPYIYSCPVESGACRRASLDLTRALARMRRY